MALSTPASFFEEATKVLKGHPLVLLNTTQIIYDAGSVQQQLPPLPSLCKLITCSDLAAIAKAGHLADLEPVLASHRVDFAKYMSSTGRKVAVMLELVLRPFEHAATRLAYSKPLVPGETDKDWPFVKGISGRFTKEKLQKLRVQWAHWAENKGCIGLAADMGLNAEAEGPPKPVDEEYVECVAITEGHKSCPSLGELLPTEFKLGQHVEVSKRFNNTFPSGVRVKM